MVVYPARARAAIEKELCAALGVDLFEAAAGILEIVNANMMGAVRVISVERGEDPREFALVAFGGAGPLHAADIARSMGIRRVIVPPRPGLLSALGLLHADVRGDFSLTRFVRAQPSSLAAINAGFAQLRAQGRGLAGRWCCRCALSSVVGGSALCWAELRAHPAVPSANLSRCVGAPRGRVSSAS
jgi:N-methylhydantoinase A